MDALKAHHAAMQAAMKAKSSDPSAAATLATAIDDVSKVPPA